MKLTKNKLMDIIGIIFVTIGILFSIGLSPIDSRMLGNIVQFIYSMSFGPLISIIIPVFFFVEALLFFKMQPAGKHIKNFIVSISSAFIISSITGFYYFYSEPGFFSAREEEWGEINGLIGYFISSRMYSKIGDVASITVIIAAALILLLFIFDFRVMQTVKFIWSPFKAVFIFIFRTYKKVMKYFKRKKLEREMKQKEKARIADLASQKKPDLPEDPKPQDTEIEDPVQEEEANDEKPEEPLRKEPEIKNGNKEDRLKEDVKIEDAVIEDSINYKARKDKKYKYQPPSTDLLNESKIKINIIEDEQRIKEVALNLEEKLREFSVEAEVVQVNPGPVITQYEIRLAKGVKVNKVTSLEDDLAMALKAKSIRIVAPIPGKGTVGVEIPNSKPSIVYLKSIISSEKYIKHKSKLAIALGKLISGENYILDLAKTPHLLIAGSTGSGKSVCINGLIISILYRATPEEVQFCLIDPKKVELSLYSGLLKHHLLKIEGIDEPVVTKSEDAVRLLEALVEEMEKRYEILQQSGTRNLEEYNELVKGGELETNEFTNEPFRKLPYIVCILDEYGDLMMTSGKAVEDPICRLAQMARAIGIHMVLATQRPSVKVVTGAIKANFPTRIGFRVMSQVDSRTILDGKGAESLLGKGDMLLIPPGEPNLVRIQNALVETKEINKVVKHIANQPDNFDKLSIKAKPSAAQIAAMDTGLGGNLGSGDDKYEEAKALVIRTGMASVSMLQRGLSVGYARAGKLIDELERNGVVGPHQGSKPRDVLISSSDDE